MLSVLWLLLTSCITTKSEIQYKIVVPDIDFPYFPEWSADDEVVDYELRTVIVPLDVYFDLAEYKADITATEKLYDRLKGLADEF